MEGFSRDFLCGIGKGDAPPSEQRPGHLRKEMEEEVELSLGLSLGGLFGIDRMGDKLPRTSSMAAVLTPPVEVPAPPALPRASGSPSSASSEGDGQRLQGACGFLFVGFILSLFSILRPLIVNLAFRFRA